MDDGKVFMDRPSLLDELFEINHIRTIYHMFIAVLLIFCLSTLAVDYIDQGRLVLEFDLLAFAFGKLGTVTWAWLVMFLYTLLVPYYTLVFWGSWYHSCPSKLGLSLGTGLVLLAVQTCVLGLFPIYVAVHYELPPASRFIVIMEQIRFLMKSYSFMRETAPVIVKNTPKEGESPKSPTLSSYLYFLFCPTLIYRESYPRNTHIRWKYVGVTFGMILGSLFYGYFILVRLCVPVFRPETNQPFSKRTMVLADWWNSTSFANYYRTWNVVVHDWLFYYGYRDFLWLSRRKFRTAGMLSVFIVSALVHEYALGMGFGFFYPVMFCLFACFGVLFNFTMNDKRQSPVFNVIMWACLFLGQGVQVCLYCQEWYAQIHCPRTGVDSHCIGLGCGARVVPASMRVLTPRLGMTRIQALILRCCRVDPQPEADVRQAVDADLTAIGRDLGDAVVHDGSYQCGLFLRGGLRDSNVGRWARHLPDNSLRDWPPQPLHLRLGGACGRHGDVADQGDGAASF
ncbi:Sterol O-acyltransferase 1 [Liparis tanakae]|uniref:Sterol O-acyltransferase 1 n=1 Tax=Liparis tanakae TaxID=230148 RepID=A0A4Z2IW57_9TELE|nr:Sterol O-acyltransferase 1 [Liparis tanakae]